MFPFRNIWTACPTSARNAIDFTQIWENQQVWKTDDPELTSRLRATYQNQSLRRQMAIRAMGFRFVDAYAHHMPAWMFASADLPFRAKSMSPFESLEIAGFEP